MRAGRRRSEAAPRFATPTSDDTGRAVARAGPRARHLESGLQTERCALTGRAPARLTPDSPSISTDRPSVRARCGCIAIERSRARGHVVLGQAGHQSGAPELGRQAREDLARSRPSDIDRSFAAAHASSIARAAHLRLIGLLPRAKPSVRASGRSAGPRRSSVPDRPDRPAPAGPSSSRGTTATTFGRPAGRRTRRGTRRTCPRTAARRPGDAT